MKYGRKIITLIFDSVDMNKKHRCSSDCNERRLPQRRFCKTSILKDIALKNLFLAKLSLASWYLNATSLQQQICRYICIAVLYLLVIEAAFCSGQKSRGFSLMNSVVIQIRKRTHLSGAKTILGRRGATGSQVRFVSRFQISDVIFVFI